MHSSQRPAWMPLAVLALCSLGTLVLAQVPGGRQPPGGFGPPGYGPGRQTPAGPGGAGQIGSPPGGAFPGGPPGAPGTMPGYGPGQQPPAGPGANRPQPGGAFPGGAFPGGPPGAMGGPQNVGLPNAGMPNVPQMQLQNQGSCSKCMKTITWTGSAAPTSCPHCGTRFDFVENADGTKTYTKSGKISRYVGIAVAIIVIVGGIIGAIVRATSGGSSRPKKKLKKKKPMRRPRDEDDDY